MKTIPHIVNMIGLEVYHGSPYYETKEVIADVLPDDNEGRMKICFEGGRFTNMSNEELDQFMDEGNVSYNHWFRNEHDIGHARMFLAECMENLAAEENDLLIATMASNC